MDARMIANQDQLSVVMTEDLDQQLVAHLDKGPRQEDLTFAYWRPSISSERYTAVLVALNLPDADERILDGNVALTPEYLQRVLEERPEGCGLALCHSHLGPGWQGMSRDDVETERDRLAGPAFGQSDLPLLGLTWGTDGTWCARFWERNAPFTYERFWVNNVRVVGGSGVRISYRPDQVAPTPTASQAATVSVWGEQGQAQLSRARVGLVGLGSVGSIIAETLARVGFTKVSLIDFDVLEERNLDRTAGATAADLAAALSKVQVAARNMQAVATASELDLGLVASSILSPAGLDAALGCDILICCVDRPWPRFLLNSLAYSHLIPVVDGGIAARVREDGTPLHVAWRIHTTGPGHACLVCQDALRMSDVALDREGKLDDPDYIQGLPEEERQRFGRRNVFPFSLSVASHQVLQLIGHLTGFQRIGGTGPQRYDAYPGEMTVSPVGHCEPDCPFHSLTASATDQGPNLDPGLGDVIQAS